ncbi:hypothetical protein GPECTOR_26g551 [Gonium pectorale]|uniref:3'-5' exonuclease domain-containing protein n=1 Tax=Gonium pectorale TaxID=33097 RepID=A0A150GFN3_GONPE|nr:hypothetical protein GPECTOR_26g551 [Gonium pectorale]|eukprot:KXZ48648.1 hypothetical protein GPECTOR_26g551 [Gonium pectorale]
MKSGYGIAQLVDNVASLEHMLNSLAGVRQLAVDGEGISLGRSGKLCLLAVAPAVPPSADAGAAAVAAAPSASGSAVAAASSATPDTSRPQPRPPVFLLDVSALSSAAFSHTPAAAEGAAAGRRSGGRGAAGPPRSLKALLECDKVTKLFYDVRADAEALFHQHGVALRGVVDLQLAEVAYRRYGPFPRRVAYVMGLSRALESYLDAASRATWQATAVDKRSLQGSYERDPAYWDRRPLTIEQVRYASDDVLYLHHLHRELTGALSPPILERVQRFSEYRIADSCKVGSPDEAGGIAARDATRTIAPAGL